VLTGLPAHAAHAVLRSAPGLTQLMAHEVEALQDAMQFQHRLAEASAAKVGQGRRQHSWAMNRRGYCMNRRSHVAVVLSRSA
jgi:hypothetical protein